MGILIMIVAIGGGVESEAQSAAATPQTIDNQKYAAFMARAKAKCDQLLQARDARMALSPDERKKLPPFSHEEILDTHYCQREFYSNPKFTPHDSSWRRLPPGKGQVLNLHSNPAPSASTSPEAP
jgi:hypothetical protein